MTSIKIIDNGGLDIDRQSIVLAEREKYWCTDTEVEWIGDGITPGGKPINRAISAPSTGLVIENFTNLRVEPNSKISIPHSIGSTPSHVQACSSTMTDNLQFIPSDFITIGDANIDGGLNYTITNTNHDMRYENTKGGDGGSLRIGFVGHYLNSSSNGIKYGSCNENQIESSNLLTDSYATANSISKNNHKRTHFLARYATIAGTYHDMINNFNCQIIGFDDVTERPLFKNILPSGMWDDNTFGSISFDTYGKAYSSKSGAIFADWDEDYVGYIGTNTRESGAIIKKYNFQTNQILSDAIHVPKNGLMLSSIHENDGSFYFGFQVSTKKTCYFYELSPESPMKLIATLITSTSISYPSKSEVRFFDDGSMLFVFIDRMTYMKDGTLYGLSKDGSYSLDVELISYEGRKFVLACYGNGAACIYGEDDLGRFILIETYVSTGVSTPYSGTAIYSRVEATTGDLLVDFFSFAGNTGTCKAIQLKVESTTHVQSTNGASRDIFSENLGTAMESYESFLRNADPQFSLTPGYLIRNNVDVSDWLHLNNINVSSFSPSGTTLDIQFLKADGVSSLSAPYDVPITLDSELYEKVKGLDAEGSYTLIGSSGSWQIMIDGVACHPNIVSFDTDLATTALRIVQDINANSQSSAYNRQVYASIADAIGADTILLTIPSFAGISTTNLQITNSQSGAGTAKDFTGERESLLDVIKSQAGSNKFTMKIGLMTMDMSTSPKLNKLEFNVFLNNNEILVDPKEIEVGKNSSQVTIRNNTTVVRNVSVYVMGIKP